MPFLEAASGDCVSSLAFEHGLLWEVVWNHPNNAALKSKRKDPNTLCPGDRVFIPDVREKDVDIALTKEHTFRRKDVPAKLALRFLDGDKPISGQPYTLQIDGRVTNGVTGGDGEVKVSIAPNAKEGTITVGSGESRREYQLQLGKLDPVEEVTGMKMRLHNLGFSCGGLDAVMSPEAQEALAAFQATAGLPPTGNPDSATIEKLRLAHEGH